MGVVWEPVDPVTAAPPPQLCDVGRSEARALEDEHHVDGPCTQARRQPRGEGPSQQGVPPSAPLLAAAHLTSQPLERGGEGQAAPVVATVERRDQIRLFEEDFLRCDELATHGLGWARPAVVEHARARHPRAQASLLATDPKALRVPIRADAPVQPDGADLPSVPVSVGRDRVEVAVEMVIVDEQALDAGLPVPVPYLLAQG